MTTYATFPNGYRYRRPITLTTGSLVPSTQTNFPVKITGTYDGTSNTPDLRTVANGGRVTNANGYDIAFYSDLAGTSALSWELASYNASTGVIEVHVKVPSLTNSTSTPFCYMFYGNPSISTFQSTASAVWDTNFKAIYHLTDVTGGASSVIDSTGTNNGSPSGSPTNVAGPLSSDKAGGFASASSQYVDLGANASIEITSSLTVEAWVYAAVLPGAGSYPRVISNLSDAPYHGYELVLGASDDPTLPNRLYFQSGNLSGVLAACGGNGAISATTWYHIAATYDGTTGTFYQNGAAQVFTFTAANAIAGSSQNVQISRLPGISPFYYWNGRIDEVRISNTARSADWVKVGYNNQSSPSTFYTVGAEDQGGVGLQRVVAQSVSRAAVR